MAKRKTAAEHPSFPFPDDLPGYGAVTVRFEALDPEQCARIFEISHNGGFGKTEETDQVDLLRRALALHALAAGGDTVALSPEGTVVHGIHLVKAIADSGIPATCLVVRNVPESSFDYSGICRRRNEASAIEGFRAPVRPRPEEDAAAFAARLNGGGAGMPRARLKLLDVPLATTLLATCDHKPTRRDLADIEGMAWDLRADPRIWPLTGESVKVGSHGGLLDGRKRCRAVVMARVPMPVVLVEGIDPAYAVTHDLGRVLNVGDKYHARRTKGQSYDILSTLTRMHWFLGGKFGSSPSVGRMHQILSEHMALPNSVSATRPTERILFQSVAVLLHYGLTSMWGAKAVAFFADFRREAASPPDPKGLVGRLVSALDALRGAGLPRDEADRRRMWLVYLACEAHVMGRKPSFRVRRGLPPIRFPVA